MASPRHGGIGQHEDGVAALVVAHQRSHVPARCGSIADCVQRILERIAVGTVGIGAVLAHDFQTGHGNQRVNIGIGKFGDAFGLYGNLEFVGNRRFQNVRCGEPRNGIAFGIGLLFEGGAGDCKPHLRETGQRVVFGGRKLQAETVLPVETLDVDRPVVLAAVEEELFGLGARNDVLAGGIADDVPFDILRDRDLARSQGAHGRKVGSSRIGFLSNLAQGRSGCPRGVGKAEFDRGGTRSRALVHRQRERQPLVGDLGLQNPLVALPDRHVVHYIVFDLIGIGHKVVGHGRNDALLAVSFVGLRLAVQFEHGDGAALRNGQHRFENVALDVLNENGQVGPPDEACFILRGFELNALVRNRNIGDPGCDGLCLRPVVPFFALVLPGARHDGNGLVGQAVLVVIGNGGLHIVDAVTQVGADRSHDPRLRFEQRDSGFRECNRRIGDRPGLHEHHGVGQSAFLEDDADFSRKAVVGRIREHDFVIAVPFEFVERRPFHVARKAGLPIAGRIDQHVRRSGILGQRQLPRRNRQGQFQFEVLLTTGQDRRKRHDGGQQTGDRSFLFIEYCFHSLKISDFYKP